MMGTKTMSQRSFGWCGVCSCACHGALIGSCSFTRSLHLLHLKGDSDPSLRLTPAVDAALSLSPLTVLTWFFRLRFSPPSLPLPPAWLGRCTFKAPNYCVRPLRCVLTCHIMNCLSLIFAQLLADWEELKTALLWAILGAPMRSLCSCVWHTHTPCCGLLLWRIQMAPPTLRTRAAVCQRGPLRLFLRHFIKPAGQGPGCRR